MNSFGMECLRCRFSEATFRVTTSIRSNFTMLNQSKVILCAISTTAMDDLEGRRDVKPEQRVHQFMKLRDVIEERASRKFFEEQAQADRPIVLRSNDFFR